MHLMSQIDQSETGTEEFDTLTDNLNALTENCDTTSISSTTPMSCSVTASVTIKSKQSQSQKVADTVHLNERYNFAC